MSGQPSKMYFERPFVTFDGNPFVDYNAYMTSLHLSKKTFKTLDADENGAWQPADPALVQQVLEDKAYIDMPDKNNQTFLNPRSVSLGIRFSF